MASNGSGVSSSAYMRAIRARRVAAALVVEVDAERVEEVGRGALGRMDRERLGREGEGVGHDPFAPRAGDFLLRAT